MTYKEFKKALRADIDRLPKSRCHFLYHFLSSPIVRLIVAFRVSNYFERGLFGIVARFVLLHYRHKTGIDLCQGTEVGAGIYFPHCGGRVINPKPINGKNCTIFQGVTIGWGGGEYLANHWRQLCFVCGLQSFGWNQNRRRLYRWCKCSSAQRYARELSSCWSSSKNNQNERSVK
jgi:hypothetical protein